MSKLTIICLTLVRNVLKQVLFDSDLRVNMKPGLRAALTAASCILSSLINETDDVSTLSAQCKHLERSEFSSEISSELPTEFNA